MNSKEVQKGYDIAIITGHLVGSFPLLLNIPNIVGCLMSDRHHFFVSAENNCFFFVFRKHTGFVFKVLFLDNVSNTVGSMAILADPNP